ncbi:hypothetical protein WJX81_005687 [Elliptochloris bilobata]|uniref:Uncharacterized protein n=1 Tax=Elliptochloris bilobata TaxID=381761 RepID=A0AAW1RIJ9_9CHLO
MLIVCLRTDDIGFLWATDKTQTTSFSQVFKSRRNLGQLLAMEALWSANVKVEFDTWGSGGGYDLVKISFGPDWTPMNELKGFMYCVLTF